MRVVKHFNYTNLRKAFQTALLNELKSHVSSSFKKTKASIYRKEKNGFYVYSKPNLYDTDTVVKYISRYPGRPVIATSPIDSYNGENVTFHYNKHADNSYVEKTVPVMDFISLLIQHIPEKHFKMTRYYGLYARHRESDQNSAGLSQNPDIEFCLILTNDGRFFFYPLATILFDVRSVTTKWSFWNSITNTNLFR